MVLPSSWQPILGDEICKPYFQELEAFVDGEYAAFPCYPPKAHIFETFEVCDFAAVKVVILGQDPYHQPGQAHGLAFSVNDGVKFPPSLRNIFKEVALDTGTEIPFSGNLTRWATQGVLLLNAALTVRHGKPGSHQGKGWEVFTDAAIASISQQHQHLVFLLWGSSARQKCRHVDPEKHLILESCHPSPLSANKHPWFGNHHFSKANDYLIAHGKTPIVW